MKISYTREMKRSYLTIETEEGEQQGQGVWEAKMLEENRIQGLLPIRVRYEDGRETYCYDITSRQPLERILENHAVTGEQVRSLFWQLYRALEEMELYLLDSGGIILKPELIYTEPERFQIGLCAVPGRKGDFAAELSCFLQYLLKHIDHRDRDCVVLAYSLYQESLKENYGIEDLVKIVADEGKNKSEKIMGKSVENGEIGKTQREAGQKPEKPDGIKQEAAGQYQENSREALPEKESRRIHFPLKAMAAVAGIFVLAALGIWLFRGMETLLELGIYLAAGAAASEVLTLLAVFFREGRRKEAANTEEQIKQARDEDDPWRILYEDEEGTDEETEVWDTDTFHGMNASPVIHPGSLASSPPEEFQTTVLSGRQEAEALHCLTAVHQDIPSIEIPYYPFVIGKHRELADYVLDYRTVSRFHLRLDRIEDRITVTDLNSTNGTAVAGVLLAANETADLQSGDEVLIADLRFIWK